MSDEAEKIENKTEENTERQSVTIEVNPEKKYYDAFGNYEGDSDFPTLVSKKTLIITLAVFLSVTAVLAVLSIAFSWSWNFWQWYIGITLCLVFLAVEISPAVFLFSESAVFFTYMAYRSFNVIRIVWFVCNVVLLLIFREYYQIIFCCLVVSGVLFSLPLVFVNFGMVSKALGVVQLALVVVDIALFVCSFIFI